MLRTKQGEVERGRKSSQNSWCPKTPSCLAGFNKMKYKITRNPFRKLPNWARIYVYKNIMPFHIWPTDGTKFTS
jgi:hypothetical protein